MSDDNLLGSYLRARRALVTPEQAGIPAGAKRRVPGLRREEVAMLAGISADYYLRLERGRDKSPSAQVLQSLARVLLLDELEQDYLLGLAAPRPKTRLRRRKPERVPARLHQLLASVQVPAFVEGRAFDVLASNRLAVALSPRLQPGYNRLRSLLLDPEEQAFQQDWTHSAEGFIAAFRKSISDDVDNPRFVELAGELALSSERFRTLWARHDVRSLDGGTTTVHHPVVGELRLHRDKLPVDGLLLVLYYADQGSESDEKLRLLASMAQPAPAPARGGSQTAGQLEPRGDLTAEREPRG
ncbi:MAG TPA: helix-turn-helix transcriptional regulator [Trebonia sp.]|nr:helix-turn-helix transcriptional regulator [Trebonia sp.]